MAWRPRRPCHADRSARRRRRRSCLARKTPRPHVSRTFVCTPTTTSLPSSAYHIWVIGGKQKGESPITKLVRTYGCTKKHPKQLYDKVVEHGSTTSR